MGTKPLKPSNTFRSHRILIKQNKTKQPRLFDIFITGGFKAIQIPSSLIHHQNNNPHNQYHLQRFVQQSEYVNILWMKVWRKGRRKGHRIKIQKNQKKRPPKPNPIKNQ